MGRTGNAIPARWNDYANVGKVIPGTKFVAFKVPLHQQLCYKLHNKDLKFTTQDLMSSLGSGGQQLGVVIDLTYTNRYYDVRDFISMDIEHVKILCPGHDVPPPHLYQQFAQAAQSFEKNFTDDRLLGVHCTHGVNRTGYFVCRYLIDHHGWTAKDAIREFGNARGHRIERTNYLDALYDAERERDRKINEANNSDAAQADNDKEKEDSSDPDKKGQKRKHKKQKHMDKKGKKSKRDSDDESRPSSASSLSESDERRKKKKRKERRKVGGKGEAVFQSMMSSKAKPGAAGAAAIPPGGMLMQQMMMIQQMMSTYSNPSPLVNPQVQPQPAFIQPQPAQPNPYMGGWNPYPQQPQPYSHPVPHHAYTQPPPTYYPQQPPPTATTGAQQQPPPQKYPHTEQPQQPSTPTTSNEQDVSGSATPVMDENDYEDEDPPRNTTDTRIPDERDDGEVCPNVYPINVEDEDDDQEEEEGEGEEGPSSKAKARRHRRQKLQNYYDKMKKGRFWEIQELQKERYGT